MIKPEELRRLNWVSYNGKYYQISGITEQYPFLNTIEFGVGIVEWKDLEPIPITEEILIKAGFENSDSWQKTWMFKQSVGLNFHNGDWYYNNLLTAVKLQSLHHLQNLFYSLIGTELKIQL